MKRSLLAQLQQLAWPAHEMPMTLANYQHSVARCETILLPCLPGKPGIHEPIKHSIQLLSSCSQSTHLHVLHGLQQCIVGPQGSRSGATWDLLLACGALGGAAGLEHSLNTRGTEGVHAGQCQGVVGACVVGLITDVTNEWATRMVTAA